MFTFLNDAEDDPFFGPHMRHMRQMNNMMSSLMADPFGMFGGGGGMLGGGGLLGMGGNMLMPGGSHRRGNALMPFMPPPLNMNRLLTGDMDRMMPGSSYSSSTVVMSSGPNGRPQVISSTSSTKLGPNGIKETRKTLEDSRTGTKKMSVGHHIGERAHVIEREHNVISGDQEETQEYINLDEEEAEDFDREFQMKCSKRSSSGRKYSEFREKAGGYVPSSHPRIAAPQLALPAPPAPSASGRAGHDGPAARRPLRRQASPLASSHYASGVRPSASVRELYSGAHPQRHKSKHQRMHHTSRHSPDH